MRLVVDCSVTMAWFLDEGSVLANAALAALEHMEAIVPCVWPLEMANSLAVHEREGRLTAADVTRVLDLIRELSIAIEEETSRRTVGEILALARTHQLSAYDASYLELAMRKGLKLATLDESLQEAAVHAGVKLFQP
ncbi:MAG TPA: type II toxin-antitoxin system VapC family toxin [Phycisphaerae bacterium]|nr:type II toxin-antitoxin system VapC family toxin [Phycisphaerae bacterium]HRY68256.1 type II toxin-antitoxin system VapC family toxin [Phycisphaerae bacterium]HSA29943.1 type II toxin-antitoxin system VapC family toxin [Phycisphaerae bacterium]